MGMIRGTTPTHIFTLPFDVSMVQKIRIIYAQNGTVKLTKTEADCTLEGNTVQVKLTQEDTLAFVAQSAAEIQVRVLTPAGDALASEPRWIGVNRLLENEVIE